MPNTSPLKKDYFRNLRSLGGVFFAILLSWSLSGCLARSNSPGLPYVKPANMVPPVDQTQVHLAARMDEMDAELQRLRGAIERMQAAGGQEGVVKNLQERVAFIERQLSIDPAGQTQHGRALPPAMPVPGGSAPPSEPSEPAGPPVAPGGRVEIRNAPIQDDERAFREAYSLVRKGAFRDAAPILEEIVQRNPKGRFAPDAAYWLGESLYGQGMYGEAVLQFDRVLKEYPGSKKELSALLKQGESFEKMGDIQSARIIFEKLTKDHPHSSQARVANTKLKALSKR
ncbi:MAG: tol-pal system protein YbgF [Desulfomonile sp.]|nr:tol-pal system protein YbgF [Desulfomonile sp.]